MNCPICNNQTFKLKSGITFSPPEHSVLWDRIGRGYDILKCGECGLEFCDPMPTEEVLKELYSKTYTNPRQSKEIVELNAQKNINYLVKYGLTKESKLLDFGCGDNNFIGGNLNWKGYDPYIYTENSGLADDNDFVILWGTLEHLVEPIKSINFVNNLLKDSGKVVITTVFNPLTNIPYNHKPPEHTLYFTKEAIKRLFDKTGFKLLEYSSYEMYQKPEIYLWCIFNSSRMPEEIRSKISIDTKEPILVPTNEVFIVGEKRWSRK